MKDLSISLNALLGKGPATTHSWDQPRTNIVGKGINGSFRVQAEKSPVDNHLDTGNCSSRIST